ncbi:MAG: DUF4347 domain-containing protein [Acidovorax sp.]|nr:DUF4347 domain-containing protein [Acidovorax sp.]
MTDIVFIDSRVQDAAILLRGLKPGAEVVYLQAGQDGLAQMAAALGERGEAGAVGSVQVIAHGSAGQLWLGRTFLDNAALQRPEVQAQLAALGLSLTADGDLLIYACDTGQGGEGAQFVDSLAALTGADVAASGNRTGALGDWELEISTGSIEHAPVLSAQGEAAYQYGLGIVTVTSSADTGAGSLREALASAQNGDTVTFSGGMTVQLTAELLLNQNITIDGDLNDDGVADVVLDGQYQTRVVEITSGSTVTLDGLVVTRGLLSGDGGGGSLGASAAMAGGIFNAGALTLNNVTVTANAASGGGGGGGATGAYFGGGGGGGGGLGGQEGGHGGTVSSNGMTAVGQPGGSGMGGNGGGAEASMGGRGGSGGGGAGGLGPGVSPYSVGGGGGSATNGTLFIGGGGGGGGWNEAGGAGGNAVGGIYNAASATLTIIGTSAISYNIGAGGGGGGGGGLGSNHSGDGGAGGRGVGAIWNEGTLRMTAANFTAMVGNGAASGIGGQARGGGTSGGSPTLVGGIYNLGGLLDVAYVPATNSAPTATAVAAPAVGQAQAGTASYSFTVTYADSDGTVDGASIDVNDVTVSQGGTQLTVTGASWNGATNTATYTVTPPGGAWSDAHNGTWTVGLAGGQVQDNGAAAVAASASAGSFTVAMDTTAPTTTVASAAFLNDTGAGVADFITRTAAQTISGTLSANLAAGETVWISLDNGGSWAAATATVGTDTFTLAGQTLTGSNTLLVRVEDAAGNQGMAHSQAYVLDTTPPAAAPTGAAFSADTGASGTDFITNVAAQTITGTLNANLAAGDGVIVSVNNGASWARATTTGTSYSVNTTLWSSNTLLVRVEDLAGNGSTTFSRTYTLDTTAPATTVSTVALLNDTGTLNNDFTTSAPVQTINGTLGANLAAGEFVQVSLDNGSTWTVATASMGSASFSLAGQTLTGSNTLQVRVVDTAGNAGPALSQAYVLDTSAPALNAAASTPAAGATGVSISGNIVLAFTETLHPAAQHDLSKITLKDVATDTLVPAAISIDGSGKLVIDPTASLAEGKAYYVTWDAGALVDMAGNPAAAVANETTYHFTTQAAPVIPDPEPPVVTPPVTPGIPDNDGIPPAVEDQAPGIPGPGGTTVAGDGNGDGIKDSEQAGVASVGFVLSPTGVSNPGSGPATFSTLVTSSQNGKVGSGNDNSRITSLTQKDAPADAPAGLQTPIGLVSFTVELAPGKTSESFSLYLDPALGVNGYWKQDSTGTWINIASEPYGGKMVLEGGRVRLDFQITDGGQFDADGKVDGIITDPGAPGHMPLSIVGLAPDMPQGFWF